MVHDTLSWRFPLSADIRNPVPLCLVFHKYPGREHIRRGQRDTLSTKCERMANVQYCTNQLHKAVGTHRSDKYLRQRFPGKRIDQMELCPGEKYIRQPGISDHTKRLRRRNYKIMAADRHQLYLSKSARGPVLRVSPGYQHQIPKQQQ